MHISPTYVALEIAKFSLSTSTGQVVLPVQLVPASYVKVSY